MNSMHILLVDDDSFLRDMYATKFTESKHTVETATTGQQALQLLTDNEYDVVLLDMVMPGMTGVELLEQAAALNKKAKYIVLSNQSEDTDKEAAKNAGAAGYIIKAESIPSDVVAKVESLVK